MLNGDESNIIKLKQRGFSQNIQQFKHSALTRVLQTSLLSTACWMHPAPKRREPRWEEDSPETVSNLELNRSFPPTHPPIHGFHFLFSLVNLRFMRARFFKKCLSSTRFVMVRTDTFLASLDNRPTVSSFCSAPHTMGFSTKAF